MNKKILNIVLADDDTDDCLFFEEALNDLSDSIELTTVYNGEQLMQSLYNKEYLPDVLFLDLNMPRKNGFECLMEIKLNDTLKDLPVIIFTTAFNDQIIHDLHNQGAHYFIQKPDTFPRLKNTINKVLNMLRKQDFVQADKENFVLTI